MFLFSGRLPLPLDAVGELSGTARVLEVAGVVVPEVPEPIRWTLRRAVKISSSVD